MSTQPQTSIHHVELWTSNFQAQEPSWDWILSLLNYTTYQAWNEGKSWIASDGAYICLVESPTLNGGHDRRRAGMNHLALRVYSHEILQTIKEKGAEHGWHELYAERYPYAGGSSHYALYLENTEGFKLELVAV